MPFALSPAISIAIAIAIFLVGLGGGALVMHWKDSGKITRLESDNSILKTDNGRCVTDIATVRKAMDAMTAVAAERERQAVEAQQQAQPQVEQHRATITRIRALPPVPMDMQCEAIKQEQIEYVTARRNSGN
jgi:hypothetical protein